MEAARRRGISRAGFIAGAGGALAAGGLAGAELLSGQGGSSPDAERLALALELERLQAAFYAAAVDGAALQGELLDFATVARDHEAEHAARLTPLVGAAAPAEARYDFGTSVTDPDAFATTAADLEDLAVSAYNGLMPDLADQGLLVAGGIVSVDARHAAWVRAILGRDPAEDATDTALGAEQVTERLAALGFIQEPIP